MRAIRVVILLVLEFWTVTAAGMEVKTSAVTARQAKAVDVKVMSFNIRFGKAADGPNHWDKRRELVFEVIRRADADFVGLQETLDFQLEQILKHVPDYEYVGVGRQGGSKGEYSAILYRSERFKVDRSGTFWLSDTPDKPSKHWGNAVIRICTWARFVEKKSQKAVYVYNTHLDHQSQPSREKSARLLIDRIVKRQPAEPFILTGDFNAEETNPVISYLKGKPPGVDKSKKKDEDKNKEDKGSINPLPLVDTFRVLHAQEKKAGTFNGFKGDVNGPKIDYIFVDPGTGVQAAAIVRANKDNRYPSDHFPVTATLRFYPQTKTMKPETQ